MNKMYQKNVEFFKSKHNLVIIHSSFLDKVAKVNRV